MWPYAWTHVGTPSQLGHLDWVAATLPSQGAAGGAEEAPELGQWEGQDVPLVRSSSCIVKGGILDSRRYLPTYLPRHADYVEEFRTCVIRSKVNTSDLQMGYLVDSRFVEGLSNDHVRRQYIVEVRSKWRSGRPLGFDTLVGTIAEAYMAARYQLQEVQNASTTPTDTAGAAVSRPLPMMGPPTSTCTMFLSNPMPTPHVNPMPTAAAAPMASTVPEPMNLHTIAKLRAVVFGMRLFLPK